MKIQTKLLVATAALFTATAVAVFPQLGVAGNGDQNVSLTSIAMPYTALLIDANDEPIDGNYSITAELFEGDDLIYAEEHVNVPVTDGLAQLVLGTGDSEDTLHVDLFVDHAKLELAISIDGQQIGPRAELGHAPKAARADRVPATGVRYGGEFGQVPASALATTVYTDTALYKSGEAVATPAGMPDGFTCKYAARVEAGIGGTHYAPDIHYADRWGAIVGTKSLDAGEFEFEVQGDLAPEPNIVSIFHAHKNCLNCGWTLDNDPDASAEVTSICTYTGE